MANNDYRAISQILNQPEITNKDGSINYEILFGKLPFKDFKSGQLQSVKLDGTFKPNKVSSVYRSACSPDYLVNRIAPELETLHDHFEKAVELQPNFECMGTRHVDKLTGELGPYTFQTYKEIQIRRDNLGSGIATMVGRPLGENYIVSIFSSNRAEWLITSLALQAYGLTSTALYDTLGPHTSKYILNLTESPMLITTYEKIAKIIDLKRDTSSDERLEHLKFVVCMDDLDMTRDFGLISLAAEAGLKLVDFKQLEKIGELNPLKHVKPDPKLCISFTSGTTGNPKGVIVTQEMATSGISFVFAHIDRPSKILKPDEKQVRYYTFLPLAHIYELMDIYLALTAHYKIYFPFDPSPVKLLEHLKMIRPHFVCLVPRVYTKFESALKQGLSQSTLGRQVISKIIQKKHEKLAKGDLSNSFLSSIVAPSIRKKLGFDSVVFANCGSAPISSDTVDFLKASLNIGFKQGYGLTESFSGISISQGNEPEVTSGPIAVSCEMRVRDVPEMNYVSTDKNGKELEEPQGELLLRGPQIFPGYYKNPKATEEAFDDEGWFKTGDIAKIDKVGRICIVDRVKNFFKLAQGEYVTPERIENLYQSACASVLSQCFIHGDSLQTFLVAILGVDINALKNLLKPHVGTTLDTLNDEEVLSIVNSDVKLKKHVLRFLNDQVRNEGLQGFEKIHNFKVKIEPLKLEDDVITPTFKIKRPIATRFFAKDFEELYEEGSLAKDAKM